MSEVSILHKLTLITWRSLTERIIPAGVSLTQLMINDDAHILSSMCTNRKIDTISFQHWGCRVSLYQNQTFRWRDGDQMKRMLTFVWTSELCYVRLQRGVRFLTSLDVFNLLPAITESIITAANSQSGVKVFHHQRMIAAFKWMLKGRVSVGKPCVCETLLPRGENKVWVRVAASQAGSGSEGLPFRFGLWLAGEQMAAASASIWIRSRWKHTMLEVMFFFCRWTRWLFVVESYYLASLRLPLSSLSPIVDCISSSSTPSLQLVLR